MFPDRYNLKSVFREIKKSQVSRPLSCSQSETLSTFKSFYFLEGDVLLRNSVAKLVKKVFKNGSNYPLNNIHKYFYC